MSEVNLENNNTKVVLAKRNDNNDNEFTAKDYFDKIKSLKHEFSESDMDEVYYNCLYLANKSVKTMQIKALKKLLFHMDCLVKEKELLKYGINTFIYKDDVDFFIDEVRKKDVVIIELENYERELPNEIVEIVEKTKHIFTSYYVLFTDYTGKVRQQIKKEKRDRDPILFGVFEDDKTYSVIERFYYLGDWIDDYCDLTLDKMVNQMKIKTGNDIIHNIYKPETMTQLRQQLDMLDNSYRQMNKSRNKVNIINRLLLAINRKTKGIKYGNFRK